MFEKLLIQNFQSLTKTKIEFDEHITTIVGPNDVGKTASIRALRWLCLNQPQGDAFIQQGKSGATVQLFVDGRKVGRKRKSSYNVYLLDDDEFRAFGSSVPREIAEILKVSDVCFQGQHEAPFWISLSAGEISRQLNAVVDLGIIDRTLQKASAKVRGGEQRLQILSENVERRCAEQEALLWVPAADEAYAEIERRREQTAQISARLARLKTTTQQTRDSSIALEGLRGRLADLNEIGRACSKARAITQRCNDLNELICVANTYKYVLNRGKPEFSGIADAFRAYDGVGRSRRRLNVLIRSIRQAEDNCHEMKLKTSETLKKLQEASKGRCPICGNELDVSKETKNGNCHEKEETAEQARQKRIDH